MLYKNVLCYLNILIFLHYILFYKYIFLRILDPPPLCSNMHIKILKKFLKKLDIFKYWMRNIYVSVVKYNFPEILEGSLCFEW